MRLLKTNTATRVTVGPFLDKTDGITPETSLTVTNCKLTFLVDDAGVPTLVLDTNPTASGGNNDMVHVTGDDAGFYDLELTAANVNYVGRAMLALTDAANHCPVFHEFMIVPANVYDSLVSGTDYLQSDVAEILGVAPSGSVPDVNVTKWYGQSVPAPGSSGIPKVDIYAIASNVAAAIAQQNLLAFCPIVTVSTITDSTHLICSDAVQTVDNAFSPNRWLFCVNATTGTNSGLGRRIIGYTGASKTFILASAFPDTVSVGDTFRVV